MGADAGGGTKGSRLDPEEHPHPAPVDRLSDSTFSYSSFLQSLPGIILLVVFLGPGCGSCSLSRFAMAAAGVRVLWALRLSPALVSGLASPSKFRV